MVGLRKVIEKTYIGTCNIIEYQKVRNANKSTGFKEVIVLESQPCRLSFETITSTNPSNTASAVVQSVKLFISPDVSVKTGSKIVVIQNDVTTEYKSSGKAAIYNTHQEIILTLFDGWS